MLRKVKLVAFAALALFATAAPAAAEDCYEVLQFKHCL